MKADQSDQTSSVGDHESDQIKQVERFLLKLSCAGLARMGANVVAWSRSKIRGAGLSSPLVFVMPKLGMETLA